MKEKLLKQIGEYNKPRKSPEKACREYCADQTIPVSDRWEIFRVAPNKGESCVYELPNSKDIGVREFSPYDDFGMDRHEVFDVVERIDDWQEETDDGFGKYTTEQIDKFKNFYMCKYLGEWEYDW
jgi:hypothetical protein